MKVFKYIRVSGKSQVGGEGPERQRESTEVFCAAHKLISLGEFFDAGVTGTKADRPAFSDMLEAIVCRRANGEEIAGFIVERLDRLARDLMVQEILLAECRKANIQVFASDHDCTDVASNEVDPTRILIRQIMGALAQFEKSSLVLKLRRAKDAIRSRTGRCEGAKPYGATPVEKVLVALLRAEVKPTTTLDEVARLLNTHGLTTRAGGVWTAKSAWRLLKATGLHTPKEPIGYRMKNLNSKPSTESEQNGRTIQSV